MRKLQELLEEKSEDNETIKGQLTHVDAELTDTKQNSMSIVRRLWKRKTAWKHSGKKVRPSIE